MRQEGRSASRRQIVQALGGNVLDYDQRRLDTADAPPAPQGAGRKRPEAGEEPRGSATFMRRPMWRRKRVEQLAAARMDVPAPRSRSLVGGQHLFLAGVQPPSLRPAALARNCRPPV